MFNLKMKTFAAAVGALALTVFMSWTFVDATKVVTLRDTGNGHSHVFVASLGALLR
jgi:hypothetical protein